MQTRDWHGLVHHQFFQWLSLPKESTARLGSSYVSFGNMGREAPLGPGCVKTQNLFLVANPATILTPKNDLND